MRFQSHPCSCGAAACLNAIIALGGRATEAELRSLAGTTKEGTSADGIVKALRDSGYTAVRRIFAQELDAWEWLQEELLRGKAVIIDVDDGEHWVAAIGFLGDKVTLADSGRYRKNVQENGVLVLPKLELLERWRFETEGEIWFQGISVGKKR